MGSDRRGGRGRPGAQRGQGQGRRPSEGEDGRDGQRLLCVHRGRDQARERPGRQQARHARRNRPVLLEVQPGEAQVAGGGRWVQAKLRMDGDAPYVTDNSNYIVDLYFEEPIKDSYAAAKAISALEGVVDHGLFLDMVTTCIIAGSDGVIVKEK